MRICSLIFGLVRNLLALLGAAVTVCVLALIAWGIISPPPRPEKPSARELEARIVAAGLRLYREAHGEWPRSLEQLKPEFLPTRVVVNRYVYFARDQEVPHIIAIQTDDTTGLVVHIYASGEISKPTAD
ncbi:MAG: hypothetical protein GX456_14210 [Verrucomicrobia bacterium]|nr:hypothetical protein [Verrucomicrobiota bacterium]